MTPSRSDIEKALDELISNEEGMRFQGLAVVLAKQKWPDLIASERKKDLGLDAHAPALLARDGKGKGLACSLTATLEKIKDDLEKIRRDIGDVSVLLFATARMVTKSTASKWADAVREQYSIELVVVSREDIITDLMVPSNASICRNHLGIHVPVEPSVEDLLGKAREAVSDAVAAWLSHPRLSGRPKIALQGINLDQEGRETKQLVDASSLQTMLLEGGRIILEAPAGRGKTTTLIQVAERCSDRNDLAFLIDLPIWITSNVDLLDFIATMPPFRSRGLHAEDLAILYGAVNCVFLLNGWNEVPDSYSENAVQRLAHLERNFSRAGIIIATRTHHIRPPLPGSSRTKLMPLNRQQRARYLAEALQSRSDELRVILDRDPVLDDLTRTPLILAEVTRLYSSGLPIPKTKVGVLTAVTSMIEQADDHRAHLERQPVTGCSGDYLAELGAQMTAQGEVVLDETHARSAVYTASRRLNAAGQIANLPEPAAVLNTLCAHHVLERLDYPSAAFRFEHQQFQELYAALCLKHQLWQIADNNDPDANQNFAREYVNMPVWEEPLRMLAEEIGQISGGSASRLDAVAAGKCLVELALPIDPVFAADLSRISGDAVWAEVRSVVSECLRSWHGVADEHHRQCALAGMIATGSDVFMDVLLPLLTNDDQEVRLKTYRTWNEFHVTSLGNDWQHVVKDWKDEHRADFVGHVFLKRRMADVAEEFATVDSSPNVRAAALHALEWINDSERLIRVLNAFDDAGFEKVLREGDLHHVPVALKPRALATYEKLLLNTNEPRERIRIRLAAAELGAEHVAEGVKKDLGRWPPQRITDTEQLLLKSALNLVKTIDPQWVSHWVTQLIASDLLWADRWLGFISGIPQELKWKLLDKISDENAERNDTRGCIALLVATADVDLAREVFSRLCTLKSKLSSVPYESNRGSWEAARRLKDLFRTMPSKVAVPGILKRLSSNFAPLEFDLVIDLVGIVGDENADQRNVIADEHRQALRKYLKEGLSFALSQNDFNGHLKAHLASALGQLGDSEDTDDLYCLVQAEIERRKQGLAARSRGERSPLADGATTGWSNWYVQAITRLDPNHGDEILIKLLSEPEYEETTARELIELAKIPGPEKQPFFRQPDYRFVWEARAGRHASKFDEKRRSHYTSALKERISTITAERAKSNEPDWLNHRLKGLAKGIAVLDGHDSAEYVMEIMALPGRWDEWIQVDALEALLFGGAKFSAEPTLAVVNPMIDYALKHLYDNQSSSLLRRCLCLLSFVDPSSIGIDRIKELISRIPIYEFREVVTAIGYSRSKDALKFLLELAASDPNNFKVFAGEWIDALAALDDSDAKRVLLSFVDPDIEHVNVDKSFDHHNRELLLSHIIDIACAEPAVKSRLYSLCKRELSPPMRLLLAKVLTGLNTQDAVIAGLNLINDNASPPIPFSLTSFDENAFFEHRPHGTGGWYTRVPQSAAEIRRRLFEIMLNDDARRRSAYTFLGQIESWRLEYGRPNSEPRHPSFDSGESWPPINLAEK